MSEMIFGDPWHGVLTIGTGKLMTNAAMEVDAAGSAPLNDDTGRGRGKLMRVKVPGIPAVTTPAGVAALGGQFLDLGIIAGGEHRLYGYNLGSTRWIYIASDGFPWLAELVMTFGGNITPPGFTTTLKVNFSRFGQFGVAGASASETITGFSFPFSTEEVTLGFPAIDHINAILYLNDISTTGNKALFSICVMVANEFLTCQRHYYFFELVLSGAAGSFSITANIQKRPSDIEQRAVSVSDLKQWWDYDEPTHAWSLVREDVSSNPPSLYDIAQTISVDRSFMARQIFAAHYDTSDATVYWASEISLANTVSGALVPASGSPSYSSSAASSEAGSIKLLRNSAEVWSVSAVSEYSSSGNQAGGSGSGTYEIGDVSGSYSNSYGAELTADGSIIFQAYVTSTALYGLGLPSTFDSGTRYYPFRYTNTLVGPVKLSSGGESLLTAFGKWSTDAAIVSGSHFYAAENPVIPNIVRRSVPIAVI